MVSSMPVLAGRAPFLANEAKTFYCGLKRGMGSRFQLSVTEQFPC